MDLKVLTETNKGSFAKVRHQPHADHTFGQSVVNKDSVPEGKRDNSAFHVEVIVRFLKGISQMGP